MSTIHIHSSLSVPVLIDIKNSEGTCAYEGPVLKMDHFQNFIVLVTIDKTATSYQWKEAAIFAVIDSLSVTCK